MTDQIWIVRAGREAVFIDQFIDEGFVGVGWEAGDVTGSPTREALTDRLKVAYPSWSTHKIANAVGQLFRFVCELKKDDLVGTYDPNQRRYYIGRLNGDLEQHPDAEEDLLYRKSVSWTHRVARDSLTLSTRNSLGAIQTLFCLGEEASGELLEKAVGIDTPQDELPQDRPSIPEANGGMSLDDLRQETITKASDFIKDMIVELDPYELQDLVAGILRAMGYKTKVAPPGPDRGVDIFASPDGLGLQEPRIFVEVKHRPATSIGAPLIRSFIGGRQPGDKCLYISTGGFSKEAFYEAERSNIPLSLLGTNEIKDLLIDHYESLDMEAQRIVPLTKIYWPTPSND